MQYYITIRVLFTRSLRLYTTTLLARVKRQKKKKTVKKFVPRFIVLCAAVQFFHFFFNHKSLLPVQRSRLLYYMGFTTFYARVLLF